MSVLGFVLLSVGATGAFMGVCLLAFDVVAGPWIGATGGFAWAVLALGVALAGMGLMALLRARKMSA
jgi:hypothetical protein